MFVVSAENEHSVTKVRGVFTSFDGAKHAKAMLEKSNWGEIFIRSFPMEGLVHCDEAGVFFVNLVTIKIVGGASEQIHFASCNRAVAEKHMIQMGINIFGLIMHANPKFFDDSVAYMFDVGCERVLYTQKWPLDELMYGDYLEDKKQQIEKKIGIIQ